MDSTLEKEAFSNPVEIANRTVKKTTKTDRLAVKQMSREELEECVLQLSAHNTQLKSLLQRSLAQKHTKQEAAETVHPNNKKSAKKTRLFDFDKHPSRHILLKFAYLGWSHQGYAVQEDTLNTIEADLFDALLKTKLIKSRQTSNYHRCGRTDKGVSAFAQVISITVRSQLQQLSTTQPCPSQELQYVDLLNRGKTSNS
ncbi:Pseudouridine synthase catalytic domain [Trinorchestia longiramus]|nr:Pseudouridine synthase catalytic domain [Trinorchestia longiramus]